MKVTKEQPHRRQRREVTQRGVTSQAAVNRRLREIWIDGFGFSQGAMSGKQISQIREGMKKLVEDENYWNGLITLSILKKETIEIMESLRCS